MRLKWKLVDCLIKNSSNNNKGLIEIEISIRLISCRQYGFLQLSIKNIKSCYSKNAEFYLTVKLKKMCFWLEPTRLTAGLLGSTGWKSRWPEGCSWVARLNVLLLLQTTSHRLNVFLTKTQNSVTIGHRILINDPFWWLVRYNNKTTFIHTPPTLKPIHIHRKISRTIK